MWKSDPNRYARAHRWIHKNMVKTGVCRQCNASRKTQWSNKSGDYLHRIHDWQELCIPCHSIYDGSPVEVRAAKGGRNGSGGLFKNNSQLARELGRKGGLAKARAATPRPLIHGHMSNYTSGKCRCLSCKDAAMSYQKLYRKLKRVHF